MIQCIGTCTVWWCYDTVYCYMYCLVVLWYSVLLHVLFGGVMIQCIVTCTVWWCYDTVYWYMVLWCSHV